MKNAILVCFPLCALILLLSPAAAVAQEDPAYLLVRDVPHGEVSTLAYESSALGTDREVVVYTPPGYETSGARYPVLYLLHGAGGDETTWTSRERAHVILDNLIADGKVDPYVVVMPYGYAYEREGGVQFGDPVENRSQREGFARDLIEDVIPMIESRYRVHADRDHRAIAGLSLGGAQSIAIGLSNLDLFSRVAGFSSAFHVVTNPETGGLDFDRILADSDRLNEQLDLLWVGCGFDDVLFDYNVQFSEQLTANKVEHIFRLTEGDHSYPVWQRYLYEVAPQLF